MSKQRIARTLAVTAAALVAGAPAAHGQPPLSAAAHLEVHANADTSAAQKVARTSGARARKLMTRGARELSRAAAIVQQAGAQASASGDDTADTVALNAQASLSTAAADQSATLSAIADKASGKVAAAAQRARTMVDAIKSGADAALDGTTDDPGVVSVSVSAQASTGSAGDSSDSSAPAGGGIQLLGTLSGAGR